MRTSFLAELYARSSLRLTRRTRWLCLRRCPSLREAPPSERISLPCIEISLCRDYQSALWGV